jgi:hypothetical protein
MAAGWLLKAAMFEHPGPLLGSLLRKTRARLAERGAAGGPPCPSIPGR